VSSTPPLHELFQRIGFLHAPPDRLFLQIQSSPEEKVFIHNQTLTNSQKCLKNKSQGKKKKDIPKYRVLLNLTSLKLQCSSHAALAQCAPSHNATLSKQVFSRKNTILQFPFHSQCNQNSSNSFKPLIVHYIIAFCVLTGIYENYLKRLRHHCLPKANSCDDVNINCNPIAHV